jgi:hypothetical protein
MLFNTRVLEFWVMEIINIYDFLHLLSLIKIRLNMNLGGGGGGGGDLAFAHICHNTFFLSPLFISKRVEKGSQAKTKLRSKKHALDSIHLFVSLSFFKLRFN